MAKPYMCGDEIPIYIPSGGCGCNYSMQFVDDEDYALSYSLTVNGEKIGETINVPYDKYVISGMIGTSDYDGTPYPGALAGDKYLQLSIAHSNELIYIPMKDLVSGGYMVVDSLPATGSSSYIYLVDNGSGYDQYVWSDADEDWINIGSYQVDLTNYYTKAETDSAFYTKQEVDALIPTIPDPYPVGFICVTSTNSNPGLLIAGTWELVDKQFERKTLVDTGVNWNNYYTKATQSSVLVRDGHTIYGRFQWVSARQYGDTDIHILQIPYTSLGVYGSPFASGETAMSDGGSAVAFITSSNADPLQITLRDVVSNSGGTAPADNDWAIEWMEIHVTNISDMLDSECDKFYWKRVS